MRVSLEVARTSSARPAGGATARICKKDGRDVFPLTAGGRGNARVGDERPPRSNESSPRSEVRAPGTQRAREEGGREGAGQSGSRPMGPNGQGQKKSGDHKSSLVQQVHLMVATKVGLAAAPGHTRQKRGGRYP